MGVDLYNVHGDYYRFSSVAWTHVLALAEQYGWKPTGTRRGNPQVPEGDWDGNYTSNSGQLVTEADARALADALERALPDIPGRADTREAVVPGASTITLHPLEFFRSAGKAKVTGFIDYCRKGGFRIS